MNNVLNRRTTFTSQFQAMLFFYKRFIIAKSPWIDIFAKQILWIVFCFILRKMPDPPKFILNHYFIVNIILFVTNFYFMIPMRIYRFMNYNFHMQLTLSNTKLKYFLTMRLGFNFILFILINLFSIPAAIYFSKLSDNLWLVSIINAMMVSGFLIVIFDLIDLFSFIKIKPPLWFLVDHFAIAIFLIIFFVIIIQLDGLYYNINLSLIFLFLSIISIVTEMKLLDNMQFKDIIEVNYFL
ncbi:hypothetical protein [Lyticum sinuosum]|uniref:Uncharacterized protein n=1 Tax=Lyticum sinuosum TaxID=1332059 RepID=A0AAE4VM75_9RICK|nr:hypothetical protein [Lyticum sinuosum]MDZ5761353.1 hypothetical protein [Lyticum sinuosum]